jgi:hypothetical protein
VDDAMIEGEMRFQRTAHGLCLLPLATQVIQHLKDAIQMSHSRAITV